MTWDASDFDDLRDEMGRGGVQYVKLWPNRKPIQIDLGGMESLIARNKIGNPLFPDLVAVGSAQAVREPAPDEADEGEDDADDAPPRAEPGDPDETADAPVPTEAVAKNGTWENTRRIDHWQDELCAALVIDPPWCRIADLPHGACPPGMLCLFDLEPAQRRLLVSFVLQGVSALKTFRERSDSGSDTLHGGGLRDDAGGPAAEPESPAPPEMVAESRDLDAREGRGAPAATAAA